MRTFLALAVAAMAALWSTTAVIAEEPPEAETKAEKPIAWQDPISGYHYMFIPKRRTYLRTFHACRNRGWDVFNYKLLSPDEQRRFLASPIYAAIPWTTRFAGEPGEIREAGVWMSTEYRSNLSTSVETLWFRWMKVENKIRLFYDLRDSGTMDEGLQLTTLCTFRSPAGLR